jgi:Tfp pilus assembly protein PilF
VRRKLNVRVFAITLGVLLVGGAAFHALHGVQVQRNAASLLDYARRAKAEKKVAAALELFSQYLRLAPADLDAVEEYALELDATARNFADSGRFVHLVEPMLVRSGERDRLRARLVDHLAVLGRFEAAVQHLDVLLPRARDAAELHHKRAWCLDAASKFEEAVRSYQRSVELDPHRVNTYLLLAEILHTRLSRDDDATEVLNEAVTNNPKSFEAYLARHRHQQSIGREDVAADDLAKARQLAPREPAVLLAASHWAQAHRNEAEARSVIEEGVRLFPDNESLVKELTALELRAGRPQRALENVEQALRGRNDREHPDLRITLADLLLDAKRRQDAEAEIAKVRGDRPAHAAFLEARLATLDSRWDDALCLLEQPRTALAGDNYWYARVQALRGACLAQLGDLRHQIQALAEAAKSEPGWDDVNLALGRAHLQAGQPEEALPYLAVVSTKATAEAEILKARAIFLATLQTPLSRRDWRRVDDALADAVRAGADPVEQAILQADIHAARKQPDEARDVLRTAIKKEAAQAHAARAQAVPLWTALAEFETHERNHVRALTILEDGDQRFGARADLLAARLRALASRGLADDRLEIKRRVSDLEKFAVDDRGRLLRGVAELWQQLGDGAAGEAALRRASQEQPRDARAAAALLELALDADRPAEARQWLTRIREAEGDRPQLGPFEEALLRIHEANGRPERLQAILKDLAGPSFQTDPARRCLLTAQLHDRLGRPDLAAVAWMDALKAGARSPQAMLRLVASLVAQRHYDRASEALALIEAGGPLPPALVRPAIDVALANRDARRARELLGNVDVGSVRDPRELVWRGDVLSRVGEHAAARATLARAIDLAPHTVEPWVAFVQACVRADDRTAALAMLDEVVKRVPTARRATVAAQCREALGDTDGADAAYRAALAEASGVAISLAYGDFLRRVDRPVEAQAVYRKLLDTTGRPLPGELQAQARRGLAESLCQTSVAQARSVLAPNLSRAEPADELLDLYLQGLVPARRAQSITKLEEAMARLPASADDVFHLAQLYQQSGNSERYDACMNQILADRADTPQMLAHFARHLLAQRQLVAATAVLARLRLYEPESPRTRELLTRQASAAVETP